MRCGPVYEAAINDATPSRGAPRYSHGRRCRTSASLSCPGTSVPAFPETIGHRECFSNATYCRASATVLAAPDTNRFRRL